ncbi:MAG TPA: ABATE domain-containing protein [Stellaceae bacterium]|nr:ABATE domain-containing protein [Stellaceae bacterium]
MRGGTESDVIYAAAPTKTLAALQRIGGHAALDFVNTVDWRGRPAPEEYLVSYPALLEWAGYAGLLDAAEAAQLRRRALDEPARAAALLRSARVLREAAHRLFLARALGKPGRRADIAIVNDALRRFPPKSEIVALGELYGWRSAARAEPLSRILERLAQIVAELLTAPELARMRLCGGTDCGWLFLDTSPNHGRRWCSMEACGNRAKARRHYARRRGERS